MLNDYQIRQGMRRLLFSGMSHAPTLPEFMKLCRAVGHLDGVPDLPPAPALAQEVTADRWTLAGNRRLLGEITRRIAPPDTKRYGRGCSAEAMGDRKRIDDKILDAEPKFVSAINTLVAMKNRWVDLMQVAATEEGVPPDEQNQCWHACMREAEAIIAAERT